MEWRNALAASISGTSQHNQHCVNTSHPHPTHTHKEWKRPQGVSSLQDGGAQRSGPLPLPKEKNTPPPTHLRVAHSHVLNLDAADPLPARLDHVLGAVRDLQGRKESRWSS